MSDIYLTFSDYEIRYYMFQLLEALDFSHSRGIMHRDVTLHNFLVDRDERRLYLIDWGQSLFYFPGRQYDSLDPERTTKHKGPEYHVGDNYYDYSVDVWSVGCAFASLMFRKLPFFDKSESPDQLVNYASVLGTDELSAYLDKYGLDLGPDLSALVGTHTRKAWSSFVNPDNAEFVTDEGIDLLEHLLRFDRQQRLTCKQAMAHAYFDPVRGAAAAEVS